MNTINRNTTSVKTLLWYLSMTCLWGAWQQDTATVTLGRLYSCISWGTHTHGVYGVVTMQRQMQSFVYSYRHTWTHKPVHVHGTLYEYAAHTPPRVSEMKHALQFFDLWFHLALHYTTWTPGNRADLPCAHTLVSWLCEDLRVWVCVCGYSAETPLLCLRMTCL